MRQVRQGIFGHQRHVGRGTVPHKFSLIIRKTERLTKEIEPPSYTLNIYIYIYIYIYIHVCVIPFIKIILTGLPVIVLHVLRRAEVGLKIII